MTVCIIARHFCTTAPPLLWRHCQQLLRFFVGAHDRRRFRDGASISQLELIQWLDADCLCNYSLKVWKTFTAGKGPQTHLLCHVSPLESASFVTSQVNAFRLWRYLNCNWNDRNMVISNVDSFKSYACLYFHELCVLHAELKSVSECDGDLTASD